LDDPATPLRSRERAGSENGCAANWCKPTDTSAILLIGSDLPGLESGDLLAAIEALRQKPLVLGPASDGGYWLLGLHPSLLNPVVSWPFSAIPWGSSTVLQVTRERAQTHGITPRLLRTRHDLDRLDDLVAWLGPHSHH
jgi:glycosyltransferase A (GT-A) superfamily protein (DUF2064 family)